MRIIDLIKEVEEKDYSDLEKLRYIYMNLAHFFAYDEHYLFSCDSRYEKDAYNNTIDYNAFSKNSIKNKVKTVCKQPAEILVQVLNEIGINAENIGYEEGKQNHITTVVYLDGKKYILNLSKDLVNIQKGFKTKYFGKERYEDSVSDIQFDVLDDDTLYKIDNKQHYAYNGLYMDDVLDSLKKEMMDVEMFEQFLIKNYPDLDNRKIRKDVITEYKIKFIFKNIKNNLLDKKKLEIYELNKFYNIIIHNLLTEEERKRIEYAYIYNEEDDVSLVYSVELSDGKYKYYEYNDKIRKFEEQSADSLIERKNEYKLREFRYQKIPGIENNKTR